MNHGVGANGDDMRAVENGEVGDDAGWMQGGGRFGYAGECGVSFGGGHCGQVGRAMLLSESDVRREGLD